MFFEPSPEEFAPRPLDEAERLARLRLARTETIGPIGFRALIARYGTARAAIEAVPELAKRGGRTRPLRIPGERAARAELKAAAAHGARALFLGEAGYPKMLAAIEDAPPVLFVQGATHLLETRSVAIVGARNASAAGLTQARRFSAALGEEGYVIVSGLARGIDGAAHEAALATGTIGVLAGGLDIVYPKENAALMRAIAEQGVLASEEPLGMRPSARHFPKRNRIVSGLSLGVVVIEAAQRSGSLITARLAGEQGREVFAVPGSPMDARSCGTNRLIKQGAYLVESADDVLAVLEDLRPPIGEPEKEGPFSIAGRGGAREASEALKLELRALLSFTPVAVDVLVRETGADPAEIAAALLELEIAGLVIRLPGGRVALRPEEE
ncbi:MAG: DNA-protecting protein DprA [Alphaproteobacteria bacterium]|nr:MAG: DNA-protecting protein DprA [Alphaproteobacteria bacterium]